ncbi:MAG: DNA translocase FtsK [Rhodospirillaceae bacterium]
MATSVTRVDSETFLPPSMVVALKRSFWITVGSAVIAIACVSFLALLSYHAADPSWNTATDSNVQNWLAEPGAVFADAMLQALGLAAVVPVLVFAAWGGRLVRTETVSWLWLRTASMPAAALLLSLGLAGVGQSSSWALPAGLGGFSGQILLDLAMINLTGIGAEQSLHWVITSLSLAAGFVLFHWIWTVPFNAFGVVASWIKGEALYITARLMGLLTWVSAEVSERMSSNKSLRTHARDSLPSRRSPARTDPIISNVQKETGANNYTEFYSEEGHANTIGNSTSLTASNVAQATDIVVPRRQSTKPSRREIASRQGSLLPASPEGFDLPPLDILSLPRVVSQTPIDTQSLESNAKMLEGVLKDFGINGEIVKVRPGPVVTLYELEPAPGTKTARVVSLADDIARSMSAVAVRIAVVPGRSVIGIELPNERRETVYFREMLSSDACDKFDGKLTLALGKDIGGAPVYADLARMPHLLIAGTTGSGKSVAINTMITSLLYRHTPDDVRLLMIDPKMLELSVYDGIPHLLSPVVTEPGKAVVALKWVVREMEDRYRAMSQLSVRNIAGYNQRLSNAAKKGQSLMRTVQTGFDPESGKPIYEDQELDLTPLPYIVVIIDEMADLMLVAGKDVEAAVQRLAQMARAAGIHVIMATQRPSVDVITGTIKANFPTRISFQVTSKIDSRTILGEQGAEQLLGQGDMLYMAAGGRITRVHGPFVTDEEVSQIVDHLKDQGHPAYLEDVTDETATDVSDVPGFSNGVGGNADSGDSLFDQAVAMVARERKASTSFVQRHLQIGYNRAARIIEEMEAQGMIGKPNHVGKREVLLPEVAEF